MFKEGKFFMFIAFSSILFLGFILFVGANNIPTTLNVNATPPYLIKDIPNQSWAKNTNLTNAFNLHDYFSDPLGNGLNFSYLFSNNSGNINISISSGGNVSFFPAYNYSGNETVRFIATDSNLSGESNLVYLDVGTDTEPPKWFYPSISPAKIYQNSFVNFTTLWTDNVALAKFIFSINQGSSWQNTTGFFSGRSNTSRENTEISAPGGTVVSWFFCGYDTSSNYNCTKMQNFTVQQQPVAPSGQSPPSGSTQTAAPNQTVPKPPQNPSFNVNPLFFKVSLKQGDSQTRLLKITNTGNTNLTFKVNVSLVGNFTTLSSNSFSLGFGTSKSITIDFFTQKYTPPGEYFGSIIVGSSPSNSVTIPVVLDVNPYQLDFEINVTVPSKYQNVNPGRIVKANISIENLKDEPNSKITLYYAIKDLSGNIYNYSEENLTLLNKLNFQEGLTVPSNSQAGTYLFYARASLGNFSTIDSDTFQVGSSFNFDAIFRYGAIVSAIFILSALSMTLFFKYRREHEKERLLNLYLMLTELKKLIKEGDSESAINLYIRIKSAYGEKVSESAFQNKDKLKEEINALSERLQKEVDSSGEETKEEVKKVSEGDESGNPNEKTESKGKKTENSKKEDRGSADVSPSIELEKSQESDVKKDTPSEDNDKRKDTESPDVKGTAIKAKVNKSKSNSKSKTKKSKRKRK